MNSPTRTANAGGAAQREVTALVTGKATGGRLAMFEIREAAGREPPLHLHTGEDEIVYVLDGDLIWSIGDDTVRVGAGACLVLPRGIEHGYAIESDEARFLVLITPAGLEGYYLESDACADIEHLIGIAARYGLAITGPPPRRSDRPTGGGDPPQSAASTGSGADGATRDTARSARP